MPDKYKHLLSRKDVFAYNFRMSYQSCFLKALLVSAVYDINLQMNQQTSLVSLQIVTLDTSKYCYLSVVLCCLSKVIISHQ